MTAPAVELAKAEGVTPVVETGNGTMGATNAPYLMGYDTFRDGYLRHVYIKDVIVDTPHATLTITPCG